MIGKKCQDGQMNGPVIQFLLLGVSHGHIGPVINKLRTERVVLFSSENLKEETALVAKGLEKDNETPTEIVLLDPFGQNALFDMVKAILAKARQLYSGRTGKQRPLIIAGLTGGTNLMTISMAMAALINGWQCHYVKKEDGQEDEILEFSLLNDLNRIYDLGTMATFFEKGDNDHAV
jgi:hypothetical protein